MPDQTKHQGLHVGEIPGGTDEIAGVATSITAFVGRALKGIEDEPVTIYDFGEYEKIFGGLWKLSTMSYAVKDFFNNGGTQAIIVRVANKAGTAEAQFRVKGDRSTRLALRAKSSGLWASDHKACSLRVTIDHETDSFTETLKPPLTDPHRFFSLTIENFNTKTKEAIVLEKHSYVTLDENESRYLPLILENDSEYLMAAKDQPGGKWLVSKKRPVKKTKMLKGGDDGKKLLPVHYDNQEPKQEKGIYALNKTDLFNLLCIPPSARNSDTDPKVYQSALELCVARRAILIVDSPFDWGTHSSPVTGYVTSQLNSLGLSGDSARNAAIFFPRIQYPDILNSNIIDTFVPCGMIAGRIACTDAERDVWKTAAGAGATLQGVSNLQVSLNDMENESLNQIGINCLRTFPTVGHVIWGGRTLRGADLFQDDYKYIAVRRTALFIEESLYRGTQWAVFEPNDETLWARIRQSAGGFMENLFRYGAFQGSTPDQAYFVKCDNATTTQNDIDRGIVNILIGFAPLKPAEFLIIQIQQFSGQT